MKRRRYAVACLSGDGIGPELMAEASRALAEVSQLHGFAVEEVHAPFGREAFSRFGHALPAATRAACRSADAVLVAATKEPALEGVKADLDLTWRIQRVRLAPGGDLAIVSPLVGGAEEWAVGRAFDLAGSRQARVLSVGESASWRELVEGAADGYGGMLVEHRTLAEALPLLAHSPGRFDVVVTEQVFAEALSDMAAFVHDGTRIVASGRLSQHGPGVFGPTHGSAPDIAGQGVANPSGILLAAALMLGEGLGERAAARTLERAMAEAIQTGVRTADLAGEGIAATTRSFMDAVLDLLPGARTDTEFFAEVGS